MELLQRAFWPPCLKPSNIAVGITISGEVHGQNEDTWICFVLIFFSPDLSLTFHRFPSTRVEMDDNTGEKCSTAASLCSSGELFASTWIGSWEPQLAHTVGGEVTLLPGSRDGVTSVFRSPGRMRLTLAHVLPRAVTSDGLTEASSHQPGYIMPSCVSPPWVLTLTLPPRGCGNY